ncbi:MAG: HAD-IIIC family phosphatase [Rhodococcus sp. (in: high G+C Gram-positive bacteria)]
MTTTNPHDPIAVSILGSSTVRGLEAPLVAELARHGFTSAIRIGGYGTWALELMDDRAQVFEHDPMMAVVMLDAKVVLDHLGDTWTAQDITKALDLVATQLEESLPAHATRRLTVLTTIPLPMAVLAMSIDLTSKARIGAAWRRFNARLLDLAVADPSIVVLDADAILTEIGPLADPRMAAYVGIALGTDYMRECARQIGHIARSRRGFASKALALDLDGTLWEGILSEDGIDGINFRHGHSGEAYAAFRRALRQLASQGVLLSILSKNDDDLVRRALLDHPDSDMSESDFVSIRADWNPKPGNLVEVAAGLGIGVDSFVFVDDSPSERGAMRSAMPSLPIVAVDPDEPALHVVSLLRDGWFTTTSITDEDTARTARYRIEMQRTSLRERAQDIETYLRDLGTTVVVFEPLGVEIARISQITQRTNQFNLTTLRMDEQAVRSWIENPQSAVLAIECADRFGDHGIVGAVFLERAGTTTFVRNFALSCRVLARGVETALLAYVAQGEFTRGQTEMIAWRTPSAKNSATASLYLDHGFRVSSHDHRAAHGLSSDSDQFVLAAADAPSVPLYVDIKER